MGETMSLSPVVSPVAGNATGGPFETAGVGDVATVAGAEIIGWSTPFCSFRRKPSFSISKTERSFFFIKSMMALMSLRSTAVPFGKTEGLGKAVLQARSGQR